MNSFCSIVTSVLSLGVLVFAQNGSVIDLGYAKYRGVDYWFGIRYAQAPIGDLRWRAPQDIEAKNNYSSTEVIDASQVGPECVQGIPAWMYINNTSPVPPAGSEDCLLLDVLKPSNPSSTSLPVVAFIHGGGYDLGSAESYPGFAEVNQSNGNLIWVSLQYRLSAYGFLSSEEIRDNGNANAGLLDQRSALQWIQRHVSTFGGDPSRVTIWGNSAGGGSVMNQMILYGGAPNPPFRAVVAEYPWWQPYHNNSILEAQYQELLNASGCGDLTCLRGLSEDELRNATQGTYGDGYVPESISSLYGYGDFYYGPSVDGQVIQDLPSNEFKQGHFTNVPLLVDHDEYEGTLFSNESETGIATETADLNSVFPTATDEFFTRLYELYPASDFNSTFFQRQAIFGDFIIKCPTYYMATAVAGVGQPVYKLNFDAGNELHAATQPFLLTVPPGDANNATLALLMRDYFASFATSLDPNAVSYSGTPKPTWPLYLTSGSNGTSGTFNRLSVNYTMIGTTEDFDASPQCDFFHGQSYVVRN
ncbi:MAG: hypothetical protein M1821_007475 [Bathelium mastoideum]|nr:MAG: hypothetical protein M1821_007475 [Bathelium mastoideum]